ILPDALKKEEFEFIRENIDLYSEDETIKKYIDTFIEKLNQVVSKSDSGKEEPKEGRKSGKKTERAKKEVKVEKASKQASARKAMEPDQVEKVSPEVSFIKRYAGMHGKTRDRQQILSFLNSLQKAIVEKRIRKASPFAKEITTIQKQLIKCYEQMGNSIDVFLEPKALEKYQKIGQSQKTLPSIAIIKQFISLHGKDGVKDKAQVLAERLARSLENEKISNSDPYIIELMQIRDALQEYLEGKDKRIWIREAELNGLMGIAEAFPDSETGPCCRNQDELQGLEPEESRLPEVIPSTDLPGMHFETIGLQGKYRELIGDPSVGFSAMVYGLPKSGKSTLCIDFAKHLAENHGKVLYVAIEEGFGYTLKEKFERLNAIHPNLEIAEKLPEDLSPFQFVFIDSVSKAGLTADALTELRKQNPSIAFIYIFHTTKDGKFRGKQDFAHDVDVIIEVEKGEARANGRFGGGKLKICL
ncbi:MAG: AAA family ATPase, partial [Bacteroidales bacterium]